MCVRVYASQCVHICVSVCVVLARKSLWFIFFNLLTWISWNWLVNVSLSLSLSLSSLFRQTQLFQDLHHVPQLFSLSHTHTHTHTNTLFPFSHILQWFTMLHVHVHVLHMYMYVCILILLRNLAVAGQQLNLNVKHDPSYASFLVQPFIQIW